MSGSKPHGRVNSFTEFICPLVPTVPSVATLPPRTFQMSRAVTALKRTLGKGVSLEDVEGLVAHYSSVSRRTAEEAACSDGQPGSLGR